MNLAGKAVRWFSPGLFGAAILCFFLPFLDISCAGQVVASFNGFDLVIGRVVEGDQARSAFAAGALAFAAAGMALAFVRHRITRWAASAAAAMATLSLLLLQFDIKRQLSAMEVTIGGAPAMTPTYGVGYWTALVFLIAAAALNGAFSFRENKTTEGRPNE